MEKNDIHGLKEPMEEAGPNMASKMEETWLEGHSVQGDLKDSPMGACMAQTHWAVNIKCVQVVYISYTSLWLFLIKEYDNSGNKMSVYG